MCLVRAILFTGVYTIYEAGRLGFDPTHLKKTMRFFVNHALKDPG